MATYSKGIIGAFSGKVGPVVGATGEVKKCCAVHQERVTKRQHQHKWHNA